MCSLDLEPCTVWRNTPRVARKAHECDCCSAPIAPATPYLDHFNVVDGSANTEKLCSACWFAWMQFGEAHEQMCTPSGLFQMLRDCVGENDDEEDVWRPVLASILKRYRLTPGGRRQLARRIAYRWEVRTERAIRPRPFTWSRGEA